MASIFEEMMTANQKLTESAYPELRRSRMKRSECRKICCKNLKVESRQFFEDNDLDELETQFEIADEATPDEVVLVIDPEIADDQEIPEDAAEEMVGDFVYKCPVCGSNYVCDCDAEEGVTEGIDVDEFGVPVECPICGDDADQILVGEIAPADEAEGDEVDPPLQEPVDEEEVEETEEVFEEDLDISVATDDEGNVDSVTVTQDDEVVVDETVEDEEEITDDEVIEESHEIDICPKCHKDLAHCECKTEDLGSDIGKYQKWVDYDMKRYGKISKKTNDLIKKAGLQVVKDKYGDYEVITGKSECVTEDYDNEFVDDCEVCDTADVLVPDTEIAVDNNDTPQVVVTNSDVELVLDDAKFESMMTKMIRENYKGNPSFKIQKVSSKGSKFKVEYIVRNGKKSVKGTLVGEGFNPNKRVMSIAFKDRSGVFTESKKLAPIMRVEFMNLRGRVVPTKLKYDYKVKVNESIYRVTGSVNNNKRVESKQLRESESDERVVAQDIVDTLLGNGIDCFVDGKNLYANISNKELTYILTREFGEPTYRGNNLPMWRPELGVKFWIGSATVDGEQFSLISGLNFMAIPGVPDYDEYYI